MTKVVYAYIALLLLMSELSIECVLSSHPKISNEAKTKEIAMD